MKNDEIVQSMRKAAKFFKAVKKEVPGYETCFDGLIQTLEASISKVSTPVFESKAVYWKKQEVAYGDDTEWWFKGKLPFEEDTRIWIEIYREKIYQSQSSLEGENEH